MCNKQQIALFRLSPNAPITPPSSPNFTLALKKCFVLFSKRPVLSPVFPCQAIFLPKFSQVADFTPNRVSAQVRGSPPPICYPEYRASGFLRANGWPTSACFWRMWERGIAWPMWACLSFNPCIFKFLPGNIGGEGDGQESPSFQPLSACFCSALTP
jgi:hypothetical protein